MKIIHLISGNLGQGGAESLIYDLATEQARLGNDVTICCFRTICSETLLNVENVKIHSLAKKKGFSIKFPLVLYKYLRSAKPDIVNCHLPAVFLYILFSIIILKGNIKFFYTIHNDPIKEEPRGWVRYLRRFAYKYYKLKFISISNKIHDKFSDLYKFDSEIIYNGRNPLSKTNDFNKVKQEIEQIKYNNNTKVFLAVGRIVSQKNYPLLLKSFSNLLDENIILLIIGAGNIDGIIKDKPENVYFLGIKKNVVDYMLNSDALCLSSSYEGFPMVIIEAMNCGLPVISTNVGGVSDAIKDGINGFLCDTLLLDDYTLLLKKFLNLNNEQREKISKINIMEFNQKYHINVIARKYIEIYNKNK